MRLLIRPFSLWVAYSLTKPSEIQKMLPSNLALAPVRLLKEESTPVVPKLLFNSYDVSSTWMNGHRVDIQTFALDRRKKTVHLVVLDCLSNVPMWDPVYGVRKGNSNVLRRRDKNDFGSVQIKKGKQLMFDVNGSSIRKDVLPDKTFVVDANRECYFGNCFPGYKMRFDEDAVMGPVYNMNVRSVICNNMWNEYRKQTPSHVFVHKAQMTFDIHVPELWYS